MFGALGPATAEVARTAAASAHEKLRASGLLVYEGCAAGWRVQFANGGDGWVCDFAAPGGAG